MPAATHEEAPGRSAFLTGGEASAWLAARGLVEEPVPEARSGCFFQFAPRPIFVSPRALFGALLAEAGVFEGGLLRLRNWHFEGGCQCDPTASYRRGRGDARPLRQVPGFVFGADERMDAADLLALVVERRWSASFYDAPGRVTLALRGRNQVDVFAGSLVTERRIQHRLVQLGAVLFVP